MKKFLFSALACVAFAGSSFASNEIFNKNIAIDNAEFAPCEVVILIYTPDGDLFDAIIDFTFPESGGPCFSYGNELAESVKRMYPNYLLSVSIDTRY